VPAGLLATLIERLGNGHDQTRVVTMEIFEEGALAQSLDVLSRYV
jgi:hypothetical protein